MNLFMKAHGHEAGPTQKPLASGAIAAAGAELPTLTVLWFTGALRSLADALGLTFALALAIHVCLVVLAGAIYGLVFQRAANDRAGGWLFGLSFGFLCWMAGPVTAMEWVLGSPLVVGQPAQGLFLSYLLWGLIVGLLFPAVQRQLQTELAEICTGQN